MLEQMQTVLKITKTMTFVIQQDINQWNGNRALSCKRKGQYQMTLYHKNATMKKIVVYVCWFFTHKSYLEASAVGKWNLFNWNWLLCCCAEWSCNELTKILIYASHLRTVVVEFDWVETSKSFSLWLSTNWPFKISNTLSGGHLSAGFFGDIWQKHSGQEFV